ncbi:MAG: alpha/beta hydrolase [Eubacteriales bacterium]
MRIELGDGAVLDTYVAKTSPELTMPPRPAVLVLPGGGYSYCSAREAEPVANLYRAAGCNAFVLYYRCGKDIASCPIKFKAPLIDAARAVDHIRSHAEEYGINPHQIAVTGFSAGGHLAGWLSANPGDPDLQGLDCRPDAMLLGYPVVSGVTSPNLGTFRTLLGSENPPRNKLEEFSVEHMITPDTPPAFIWHTADDGCVPVQNSLLLAEALSANGVPFELHIFPHGPHGLSVATGETSPRGAEMLYDDPYVARWTQMAVKWLLRTFGRKC